MAIAAMTGCRRGGGKDEAAPWWETAHEADFSGTISPGWPLCDPFMDSNYESAQGFLVVEKVEDHPNLEMSGVKVGDICLSWNTRYPEVPETLREAWLDFLNWGRGDEDVCWFARENGGEIEVFSCGAGILYECMVALGTFGLALTPTEFDNERFEKIEAAAKARKNAAAAEREELLTLSPPLQDRVQSFEFAFKTDDGAWRGRVDKMDNNMGRLALWWRGRSLSAFPHLVTEVAWRPDGDGGNGSYEPVAGYNPFFVRLEKSEPGTGETPTLVLVVLTSAGEERRLAAQRALWWDLRIEQAASEPDPFVPEQPEQGFEKTLHPSLVRVPFEPVLCFEADDGTIAGRIDHLPTKDLAEWREPWKRVDFDDTLRIYRIALFKCPVKAGAEPMSVFYATRRVNGTSGGHTYVDATWWHSLDVNVGEVDPPGGTYLTSLELQQWPVASPQLGYEELERLGGTRVPAHLVRWKELCAK
jgi:hypothetical protein